jgi:hypothetical protein
LIAVIIAVLKFIGVLLVVDTVVVGIFGVCRMGMEAKYDDQRGYDKADE